jgi:lipopolysaccharide transport system ATP-binding protein
MSRAVHVFDLSKRYLLGQQSSGYELLSDRLRQLGRRRRRPLRQELWALRDLAFDLDAGDTLGVIGHNGAGKSTLLKILSRVTLPTTGGVDLNGRVGSLLEVGTGFHAELTGAENIYLNGAVLGMRRSEIARRFDEIVEFAEVADFINTPVKRYSSGMYTRLAFAVAAHLEPEILIVDEVLAVGDLAFQEKCIRRMEQVARDGRTVLFVSHNVASVASLCRRAIMLEGGRLVADGPTDAVIDEYVASVRRGAATTLDQRRDRQGSGRLRFSEVELRVDGEPTDTLATYDDVTIVARYETDGSPLRDVGFSVSIKTLLGRLMLNLDSTMHGTRFPVDSTSGEVACRLPSLPLPPGSFTLTLYAYTGGEVLDLVERASTITVIGGLDGSGPDVTMAPTAQAVLVDYDWLVG